MRVFPGVQHAATVPVAALASTSHASSSSFVHTHAAVPHAAGSHGHVDNSVGQQTQNHAASMFSPAGSKRMGAPQDGDDDHLVNKQPRRI
jgi:hypothetical protein